MDQSKQPSVSASSFPQEEALEFELTNIEEARRVLDAGSLTQFDVASVVRPEQWKRLRRRSRPTDRALTGQAIDWMLDLPSALRPQNLSVQFPRITNALAEVWLEPQQYQAALNKLLCDGRKGRNGFPDAVRHELAALRSWTETF